MTMELLVFLGCVLGYVTAGGITARTYYARKMDRRTPYGTDHESYLAGEFAFNSIVFFLFWWLAIPGYVAYRLYCNTVLAPTPKQRARLDRERQLERERELQELQSQVDAVAQWRPPTMPAKSPDILFTCCGPGPCPHSEAFARQYGESATREFLDGDGWG